MTQCYFLSINKRYSIPVTALSMGARTSMYQDGQGNVHVTKMLAKTARKILCTVLQHSEQLLQEEPCKVHINTYTCNWCASMYTFICERCVNEIRVNSGGRLHPLVARGS